jgi:short-subunit dehydrogenase
MVDMTTYQDYVVDMITTIRKKVALVTGANKGIGKVIARGLAWEDFIVYLGARDTDDVK